MCVAGPQFVYELVSVLSVCQYTSLMCLLSVNYLILVLHIFVVHALCGQTCLILLIAA